MSRRLVALAAAGALTLALLGLPARPAAAVVNVADDLHTEYDACIAKFTASGLRDLVDQLDKSKREFVIKKASYTKTDPDSETNAANGTGSGGTTKWNPADKTPFEGDGVLPDMCATLYHEMSHLADYDNGVNRRDTCRYMKDGKEVSTGVRVNEVKATRKENVYRDKQTPKLPKRTAYGKGTHLPPDGAECLPKPPDPPSRGCNVGCAIGAGDPHLKTFDDLHYDFQAVGEFVLTRATGGDPLEVQGRASALGGLRTVSLFSAVAADVAGERVGIYRLPGQLRVHIGGKAVETPIGTHPLPRGGTVERFGVGAVDVRWPDGSLLHVRAVGTASVRLSLTLAPARGGKVEGLFGNFDGKPEGDLVVRGGSPIGEKPSFETLYKTFGESWRVPAARSLFDYGPGESTETFTDRTFPDKAVSAADLPNRATAEVVCRRAGVTEQRALEACILDVGLTGEVAFAIDAVAIQRLVGAAGTTVLTVSQPGSEARLSFPGTAGQKIFIDVPASTLPDDCSPLQLRDPGGKVLRTGCIINGAGFVDATVLPAAGEYSVVFKPSRAAGQASVRVVTAVDQEMTVAADGTYLTSTIAQAGAVTRLRFTGKAGQRVFLDVPSSTLPDECSPLQLRDPQDGLLRSGCVINGRGFVDGTVLPADGQYTVVIDPVRNVVGISELRLVTAVDQIGTIAVNGSAVDAVVRQPGAIVRLTFSGTAGQRLAVEAVSSTLADMCSPLQLRDPAGDLVASGCVINGKGDIRATVLPVTGQYSLVVDPDAANTGSTQLRLRTT